MEITKMQATSTLMYFHCKTHPVLRSAPTLRRSFGRNGDFWKHCWPILVWKWKWRLGERMTQTSTFASWLGHISHSVSIRPSSHSCHVTWPSYWRNYNELRVLLTLLSLLKEYGHTQPGSPANVVNAQCILNESWSALTPVLRAYHLGSGHPQCTLMPGMNRSLKFRSSLNNVAIIHPSIKCSCPIRILAPIDWLPNITQ